MTPEYDEAFAKYYATLKILPLPLISWDFFDSKNFQIGTFNKIQKQWKSKISFEDIVYKTKREILVTDLNQQIIFASDGIHAMNGWRSNEIIGKSPKIFQGKLTSIQSKSNIRNAILNKLPFKEIITNYRKNGSTYLCEIEGFPMFNKKGTLVNYVAFESIAS